ncbi:MAG: T9SS type A sorting domain-containing protein [Candidatus Kapabacteria bacterium]|nr:T9SS type A sorting domain-containing protein [Candidatus Kapabacteria bacterium]
MALLNCGKNNFSYGTTSHLFYEPNLGSSITNLTIGVDYNWWHPVNINSTPNCVIKKININPVPTNYTCYSESPLTSCEYSGSEDACPNYIPIINFPFNVTGLSYRSEEIIEQTPANLSFDTLFYTVKNHLYSHSYNGTDTLNTIQNALLNGAMVGDSTYQKLDMIKPYFIASMNDTSNNQHNRLCAMYRLQLTYEWLRKCDSLHIINNLILANAESNRDTMMVDWSNKRTKISVLNLSNFNYVDSMRTIYLNRVIDDIAIKYDSLGYAYKKSLDDETDNSTIETESVIVSPNPFDQQITININLITRSKVEIKLITLDGKEVTNLFNETLNAGTRVINKDIIGISRGAYYLIVKINDFQYLNKVVKE